MDGQDLQQEAALRSAEDRKAAEDAEIQRQMTAERLRTIATMVVGGLALAASTAAVGAGGAGLAASALTAVGIVSVGSLAFKAMERFQELLQVKNDNQALQEQLEQVQNAQPAGDQAPSREAELEKTVAALTQSLSNARTDIRHLVSENRDLVSQNGDLTKSLDQSQERIADLTTRLAVAQTSDPAPSDPAPAAKGPRP